MKILKTIIPPILLYLYCKYLTNSESMRESPLISTAWLSTAVLLLAWKAEELKKSKYANKIVAAGVFLFFSTYSLAKSNKFDLENIGFSIFAGLTIGLLFWGVLAMVDFLIKKF